MASIPEGAARLAQFRCYAAAWSRLMIRHSGPQRTIWIERGGSTRTWLAEAPVDPRHAPASSVRLHRVEVNSIVC